MPDDLRDEIKTMMVENLMLKVPKEQIGNDLPLFSPEGLGLDSIDALELVGFAREEVWCHSAKLRSSEACARLGEYDPRLRRGESEAVERLPLPLR
jgi:hypothetical protein